MEPEVSSDNITPVRRTSRARKVNSRFVGDDVDETYRKLVGRITAADSSRKVGSKPGSAVTSPKPTDEKEDVNDVNSLSTPGINKIQSSSLQSSNTEHGKLHENKLHPSQIIKYRSSTDTDSEDENRIHDPSNHESRKSDKSNVSSPQTPNWNSPRSIDSIEMKNLSVNLGCKEIDGLKPKVILTKDDNLNAIPGKKIKILSLKTISLKANIPSAMKAEKLQLRLVTSPETTPKYFTSPPREEHPHEIKERVSFSSDGEDDIPLNKLVKKPDDNFPDGSFKLVKKPGESLVSKILKCDELTKEKVAKQKKSSRTFQTKGKKAMQAKIQKKPEAKKKNAKMLSDSKETKKELNNSNNSEDQDDVPLKMLIKNVKEDLEGEGKNDQDELPLTKLFHINSDKSLDSDSSENKLKEKVNDAKKMESSSKKLNSIKRSQSLSMSSQNELIQNKVYEDSSLQRTSSSDTQVKKSKLKKKISESHDNGSSISKINNSELKAIPISKDICVIMPQETEIPTTGSFNSLQSSPTSKNIPLSPSAGLPDAINESKLSSLRFPNQKNITKRGVKTGKIKKKRFRGLDSLPSKKSKSFKISTGLFSPGKEENPTKTKYIKVKNNGQEYVLMQNPENNNTTPSQARNESESKIEKDTIKKSKLNFDAKEKVKEVSSKNKQVVNSNAVAKDVKRKKKRFRSLDSDPSSPPPSDIPSVIPGSKFISVSNLVLEMPARDEEIEKSEACMSVSGIKPGHDSEKIEKKLNSTPDLTPSKGTLKSEPLKERESLHLAVSEISKKSRPETPDKICSKKKEVSEYNKKTEIQRNSHELKAKSGENTYSSPKEKSKFDSPKSHGKPQSETKSPHEGKSRKSRKDHESEIQARSHSDSKHKEDSRKSHKDHESEIQARSHSDSKHKEDSKKATKSNEDGKYADKVDSKEDGKNIFSPKSKSKEQIENKPKFTESLFLRDLELKDKDKNFFIKKKGSLNKDKQRDTESRPRYSFLKSPLGSRDSLLELKSPPRKKDITDSKNQVKDVNEKAKDAKDNSKISSRDTSKDPRRDHNDGRKCEGEVLDRYKDSEKRNLDSKNMKDRYRESRDRERSRESDKYRSRHEQRDHNRTGEKVRVQEMEHKAKQKAGKDQWYIFPKSTSFKPQPVSSSENIVDDSNHPSEDKIGDKLAEQVSDKEATEINEKHTLTPDSTQESTCSETAINKNSSTLSEVKENLQDVSISREVKAQNNDAKDHLKLDDDALETSKVCGEDSSNAGEVGMNDAGNIAGDTSKMNASLEATDVKNSLSNIDCSKEPSSSYELKAESIEIINNKVTQHSDKSQENQEIKESLDATAKIKAENKGDSSSLVGDKADSIANEDVKPPKNLENSYQDKVEEPDKSSSSETEVSKIKNEQKTETNSELSLDSDLDGVKIETKVNSSIIDKSNSSGKLLDDEKPLESDNNLSKEDSKTKNTQQDDKFSKKVSKLDDESDSKKPNYPSFGLASLLQMMRTEPKVENPSSTSQSQMERSSDKITSSHSSQKTKNRDDLMEVSNKSHSKVKKFDESEKKSPSSLKKKSQEKEKVLSDRSSRKKDKKEKAKEESSPNISKSKHSTQKPKEIFSDQTCKGKESLPTRNYLDYKADQRSSSNSDFDSGTDDSKDKSLSSQNKNNKVVLSDAFIPSVCKKEETREDSPSRNSLDYETNWNTLPSYYSDKFVDVYKEVPQSNQNKENVLSDATQNFASDHFKEANNELKQALSPRTLLDHRTGQLNPYADAFKFSVPRKKPLLPTPNIKPSIDFPITPRRDFFEREDVQQESPLSEEHIEATSEKDLDEILNSPISPISNASQNFTPKASPQNFMTKIYKNNMEFICSLSDKERESPDIGKLSPVSRHSSTDSLPLDHAGQSNSKSSDRNLNNEESTCTNSTVKDKANTEDSPDHASLSSKKRFEQSINITDLETTKSSSFESNKENVSPEIETDTEPPEIKNGRIVAERLKSFEHLDENLYLFEKKKCKRSKEVRRMLCDCSLTKEEMANGEMGCGGDCLNRMLMIECGPRCPLRDHCTNCQFRKKNNAKVEVFNAENKGCGLKACENIPGGAFIMEYIGEVFDTREFKKRKKEYSKGSSAHFYFMALRSDQLIDATHKGNISRFINHSCDPNCETQKWTVNGELRIGFFATKSINPGEEINFDYRLERYGREPQKCYCGTAICRGWLGESPDEKTKEEKEEDRRKELKDKKKREDKRLLLEDMDLEEEIEKLNGSGLRNRQDTLDLSRLMVRAEESKSRLSLLNLLKTGEPACRRLFLDYHGLKLLWSWMADLNSSSKNVPVKLEILKTLECLPITNKTQLTDSRVLSIVERWSKQSPDCKSPTKSTPAEPIILKPPENKAVKKSSDTSEDSDTEAETPSPDENSLDANESSTDKTSQNSKPTTEENSATDNQSNKDEPDVENASKTSLADVISFSLKLLPSWTHLSEAFRIPKKERMEMMKEHEREVDRGYRAYLAREKNADKDRFEGWGNSRNRKKEKLKEMKERRRKRKEIPGLDDEDKGLTKEERRAKFAKLVAKQDEERLLNLQQEMWALHLQRCSILGQDPYLTPIFDPTGQFYWDPSIMSWQPYCGPEPNLPVPANYAAYSDPSLIPPQDVVDKQHQFMAGAFYPLPQPPLPEGEPPPTTPTDALDLASIPLPGEAPVPPSPGNSPSGNVVVVPHPQDMGCVLPFGSSENSAPLPLPPPGSVTITLPPKWKIARNYEGFLYFYHSKTRVSQWNIPSADAASESTKKSGSSTKSDSESDSDSSTSSSSDSEYFSSDEEEEVEEEKDVTVVRSSDGSCEKMVRSGKGKRKHSDKLVQERVISPILFEDREAARRERREAKVKAREEARTERWQLYRSMKEKQRPAAAAPKKEKPAPPPQEIYDVADSPNEDDDHFDLQLKKYAKRRKLNEGRSKSKGKNDSRKERMESAMADNSDAARKIKDSFRSRMATFIVSVLNPYRRSDCKEGRIVNTEDFKYLARKLTHFVMVKELKQLASIDGLVCNESVKHKTKEFVRKYMGKYGSKFKRDPNDTKEY